MSCSGFPSCRWTGPANAVEMELGRKLLEAQEALAQARSESGSVTWRDIRALLAWAHPDRHPGGVDAHELAVRISDLMHRARQSEAA